MNREGKEISELRSAFAQTSPLLRAFLPREAFSSEFEITNKYVAKFLEEIIRAKESTSSDVLEKMEELACVITDRNPLFRALSGKDAEEIALLILLLGKEIGPGFETVIMAEPIRDQLLRTNLLISTDSNAELLKTVLNVLNAGATYKRIDQQNTKLSPSIVDFINSIK